VGSTILAAAATVSAQTLGIPTQDTSASSTNTALAKCLEVSGAGCSADGEISSIQINSGSGNVAQPAWIEWPISGDTNTNTGGSSRKTAIKLKPTDGTMKGTHSIIVTWTDLLTPAHTHTYTALTFTVGCEITSFTLSGSYSTSYSYNVFTQRSIYSLAGVSYDQVPACGYTF
jgi:hypothetical protein